MNKLLENLRFFVPICTIIITFTAVLSFLLVGVNALLSPIKANQTRIETELKEIKSTLNKVVEKQESNSKPRRGTASQEK